MFDFAPETIKKEYFVVATIILVLAVAIGYAFGADAGYKKGLEDGGHQPTTPISLTAP
jgi:ABC-type dipeptide/oligopeptide/nickel transport system permease subunit